MENWYPLSQSLSGRSPADQKAEDSEYKIATEPAVKQFPDWSKYTQLMLLCSWLTVRCVTGTEWSPGVSFKAFKVPMVI